MKRQLRTHVAALMLLAPAAMTLVAEPAVAQSRRATPEIHTLSLNADNGLSPGSVLQFALEGTPGSKASVALGRTNIVVPLKQTSAGMYRGSYTVRRADRIDPTALLQARLTRGKVTVAHNFTYPASFQALAQGGPPAVAAAPRIERFAVMPVGRLEPGRELRFRLTGVPGATASFDIPGVVSGVPMREVNPGQYVGTYTIRQRDDLDAFDRAVATLRSGNQWVTARIDQPFARDNRAPQIANVQPRHGAVVTDVGRVQIAGDFEDRGGRGVNPDTVRLRVDGRDVTADARITPDHFAYRADLPPGRYTAEVTARDFAGNHVSQSWTFDVASQQGSYPGGRLPLSLSSPSNNATVDANGNVFVQGQTAPYASVRVQVDAISPVIGGRVGVAQTVATEQIQADRDGRFSLNLSPRGGIPLPGSRYEVQVTASQGSQTAESRITLYQRS
jgi:hypothetical protein